MNKMCGDIPSEVLELIDNANWIFTPGNAFGTDCCVVSPSDFTCAPTPSPTFVPSGTPTMLVHSPTSLPSYFPTSLPSMVPSSPTGYPTNFPTTRPSSLPTSAPSYQPTFNPTIHCEAGTYLDGLNCVECSIGYYSGVSQAPFATECTLCPKGQYNTATGSTYCKYCAAGKLSSPDRSFCEDCEAGQYNYNNTACVNCEKGKYAPQPLTDSCLDCVNGSHTNNETKATTCTSCDAGKYSSFRSFECLNCVEGKSSSSGAVKCEDCAAGFYAPALESSTCTACSAGNYSTNAGAIICNRCPLGTYQGSTSQSNCLKCEAGKYADTLGSVSCTSCEVGYDSQEGSSDCVLAKATYYLAYNPNNLDSKICPGHATCVGGYRMPIPGDGYWVDRSKYAYAGSIYKCARGTCHRNSFNSTCWDNTEFDNSDCVSDDMQCSDGAGGPLCGSCLDGHVFQAVSNTCDDCDGVQFTSYLSIGIILFLFLIVVIYFATGDRFGILEWEPVRFLLNIERGSLKVLWVTYQIVVSSSYTIGIQFPRPFSGMLNSLLFLSFDFLTLECLNATYFTGIYIWCILPFALFFSIIMVGFLKQTVLKSLLFPLVDGYTILNDHIWLILLLSYVVLPPVSNKQLQAFDCVSISGNKYLRAHTTIDCESDSYLSFRVLVIMFIGFYQFIPILWMVLLYRKKSDLNPSTSSHDLELAMYIRDNNDELTPLRFLFVDYKCSKW